jgi:hypothetical protein
MDLEFSGEVIHWRGPAPHHFVRAPDATSDQIADVADLVTYGWGAIPVSVRLGTSTWRTSLFPKDGGYLVPLRADVRRRENIELGDTVTVRLELYI